jgi:thiamine kinase-like enzyme
MNAAAALSRIQGFAEARLVVQLSDGPTNASFLVEREGAKFVLRLDRPETATLGLDRVNEKLVSEAVAAADLGAEYLYFDPRQGICLRPWLTGRSWSVSDLQKPRNLERLAVLLRKLHSLQAVGKPFEPLAAARRYAAAVGTEQAARLVSRAADAIGAGQGGETALCHNDLVCENIFEAEDGRLLLIDWEYAGVGDPYFDLAVVVQHHCLESTLSRDFLDAWLGRPATTEEQNHLSQQCSFYQCLLKLWQLRLQLP